jgi:iron complex outermembrane receptor protein
MKVSLHRGTLLAGTALGIGLAAPVQAAPDPAAESTAAATEATQTAAQDEESVIVNARRRAELLQDVPISISVFNQERLTDLNVVNAQDLATYTPSLATTTTYGPNNSTFAIRGFVQETGTGPSVGVYFADVVAPRGPSQGFPAGDGAGPGMFFDLENVQVLKGPQGTLFGRNTTGGAVLFVPRKPTRDLEGFAEVSIGNYDMRRLQAVLNLPIADTVRLRVGGDINKRDGYAINDSGIGPRDFDDVNYVSLRGSLVIDITPTLENYTIGTYVDSDTNGHVQKIVACNPTDDLTNLLGTQACDIIADQDTKGFNHLRSDVPDPYAKLRQWQAINTTTWEASDQITVKNIISYAELRTKIRSALFGTQFVFTKDLFFPGFPAQDTPVGFANIRHVPDGYSSNQSTFTEELQVQGEMGALTWQAGGYYEDSKPIGFIGSQSPVFLSCLDPDDFVCTDITTRGALNYTVAKNTFKTRGLYAQGTYALSEQFKLNAGIRYTWDKARSISRQITYTFPFAVPDSKPANQFCTRVDTTTPPLCELTLERDWSAPTWMLGVDYLPTKDVLLYGKYSRGYRTGGIKADVPLEFAVFEPEKVDSFEIGAKTSFRGAVRGHFNIAAFYNNFSDQQIQLGFIPNPASPISVAPTAGPVNIGKSRIWGIEVDAQIRPVEGLALDAAYTYLDTKVKEVGTATLPPTSPYLVSGQIVAGDELALTPKHKLVLSATYTLPLEESIGRISLGGTYVYTSKQISTYSLRDPAVSQFFGGKDIGILPSYDIVNLNLNWDEIGGGPIDASLFVTNLFNEKYLTSVNGIFPATGFDTGAIGEPRMYGVRARVRFGGGA